MHPKQTLLGSKFAECKNSPFHFLDEFLGPPDFITSIHFKKDGPVFYLLSMGSWVIFDLTCFCLSRSSSQCCFLHEAFPQHIPASVYHITYQILIQLFYSVCSTPSPPLKVVLSQPQYHM